MQKESNLSKRPRKNILNELLQQKYLRHKQLYFQLQKLLTDKRLRHRNNLCTLIRKHLQGPLRKKINIAIYQNIFIYIPQVYRQYIFYMGRQ